MAVNKKSGESTMSELALRQKLSTVNAEWHVLSRERDKCAKMLRRMDELRTRRLALMTELFELQRQQVKDSAA